MKCGEKRSNAEIPVHQNRDLADGSPAATDDGKARPPTQNLNKEGGHLPKPKKLFNVLGSWSAWGEIKSNPALQETPVRKGGDGRLSETVKIIPQIITRLFRRDALQPLVLTGGQPLPQPAAIPTLADVEPDWKARIRRMEEHVAVHRRRHQLAGGGTIESDPLQEITNV